MYSNENLQTFWLTPKIQTIGRRQFVFPKGAKLCRIWSNCSSKALLNADRFRVKKDTSRELQIENLTNALFRFQ